MIKITRKTKETDITCVMGFDEGGTIEVNTGLGFLDHMLVLMAYHGQFALTLDVKGDLKVDDHHTVEDVGLVIGDCLNGIIETRKGLNRYGSMMLPMDEVLSQVVVDCCKRPTLVFNCDFKNEKLGDMTSQNIKEFFKALVQKSQIALHLNCLYGENDHHKAESLFKGFGHAMKVALIIKGDRDFSTKGVL